MSLIKWEQRSPVAFLGFRDEMDRLFDDFFHGWPSLAAARKNERGEVAFMPKVNLKDDKERYLLDVEVPGLKKEDVKVTIDENYVIVEGERKEEREERKEEGGWHVRESSYGFFRRVVPLADPVMADKADAKLADGVLRLTLPKAKPTAATAVEVKVE